MNEAVFLHTIRTLQLIAGISLFLAILFCVIALILSYRE